MSESLCVGSKARLQMEKSLFILTVCGTFLIHIRIAQIPSLYRPLDSKELAFQWAFDLISHILAI